MVNRIVILAMLYMTLIYGKCSKTKGCLSNRNGYAFSIDSKLFPNLDSININDTIWLEIKSSSTLKDNLSGQMISYNNAVNLGTVVGLIELLGNTNFRGAYSDFILNLKFGSTVSNTIDPASMKEYLFRENNNEYIFLLGFVAKKTGIYRLSFGNAANYNAPQN
jgi:hypothetical protein